jgi:hypothetical protein
MRQLARFVSIAGHPLVLVPLAIALATFGRLPHATAATILAVVLASMAVLAVYVVIQVRRGAWTNVDVSTREHRPKMYLVAIASTVAALALLYSGGHRPEVLRGTAAALAVLIAGFAINYTWLKMSLHTAFAMYAAMMAATADPLLGAIGLAIALAVGWSRVALGRHTIPEVIAGVSIGAAAGLLLWL